MGLKRNPGNNLDDLLQRGFRFAFSLTNNTADAEDILHEACEKIIKISGPFHKGYLFTTIRNSFIDKHRSNKNYLEMPIDDYDVKEVESDGFVFDENEKLELDGEVIDKALSKLKPKEREIIYLSIVEEYTAQEIADMIDSKRGTVLSIIFRAKKKLRELLKELK